VASPSGSTSTLPAAAPPLADFLRENSAYILARWLDAIRDCTPISQLSQAALVDHAPLVVQCLADAVQAIAADRWAEIPSEGALRRALARLGERFDLKQVVTELSLLRHILVELVWERRPLIERRLREIQDLGWALDAAIRQSVEAHTFARQRALEAFDQLREQAASVAQRKDEALERDVLGVVSHDMRTPLTTIKLSTDVLFRDESVRGRHGPTVERLRRNTVALERLVADLLDFTRMRAGLDLSVERRPTDLAALCREVVAEAQMAHPAQRIALECTGDCRGAWDSDRLLQALSNLVSNACQHGSPGAPVAVRCSGTSDGVRVDIESQGPPIAPELQRHMFEPFRRGERSDQASKRGYGLGLFITREIVRAHAGAIRVDSNAQRTLFELVVPR